MSAGTTIEPESLLAIARSLVERAESGEQLEVAVSESESTSVRVYEGAVESFTSARNRGVGIRVIRDGREGFASAGSLDPDVLAQTLADARDNAGFAEADEHAGIAEPDGVAAVDIDLWRDSVLDIDAGTKIATALDLESRVKAADPRISGVRTATFGDSAGAYALVSTAGIEAGRRSTSVSASVQALAPDGERTQIGGAGDAARELAGLDLDGVVDRAVSQTLDLLGATKPATATVSLVLDPRQAATVLGLVAGTLTGDRVLKGRSLFIGREGEQIASPLLSIVDDPTDPLSLGADSHDGEGLACRRNPLVTDGVLDGFLHDAYTGRRTGVGSTGSAVRSIRGLPSPGVQALAVAAGGSGDLDALIKGVDLGVLVFGLAGLHSGVNPVSGDFSVGVEGRMIRNGELAEPISECTVSSTLQRLLLGITAVGSDVEHLPSGVTAPGLVIGDVMLSGQN